VRGLAALMAVAVLPGPTAIGQCGGTTPRLDADQFVIDTVTRTARGAGANAYTEHNCLAVARFKTSARSLQIGLRSDSGKDLAVYVNGVFVQTVTPVAADGLGHDQVIQIPGAGVRTVEIYEGAGLQMGSPVAGTWLQAICGQDIVADVPVVGRRLAVYGDSIMVGYNATAQASESLWPLVRQDYPGRVAIEAYTARQLNSEPNLQTLGSLLVSMLFGAPVGEVWLAIGTNDYGIGDVPPATFQSKYIQLLDYIHASAPNARVWCQSPIVRVGETTPNGHGDTLPDYRAAVLAAATARSSFATYVNGAIILALSDLSGDGVHPSSAGFVKYKAFVKATIGY
jgi:lysophospholipase L1-like esterase